MNVREDDARQKVLTEEMHGFGRDPMMPPPPPPPDRHHGGGPRHGGCGCGTCLGCCLLPLILIGLLVFLF